MAEETRPTLAVADPAPLGLAAFAATTLVLSVHNALGAKSLTLLAFFGLAVFYGGAAQFAAGMWEFRNKNAFGATAFTTYAAFWMGLATFVALILTGKVPTADIAPALAYILLAFTIFTTYMMIWSSRINVALFVTLLALEVTFILLVIGNFNGTAAGSGMIAVGGWAGIVTAALAWYTGAAALINGMAGSTIMPVGRPLWGAPTISAAPQAPPVPGHA